MGAETRTADVVAPVGGWAIGLPLLRIGLVAAASTLTWLVVLATGQAIPFPPTMLLASVAMLPVNVVCLLLVARLLRRDGRRIRDGLGVRRGRTGRDLLWGLLWLAVLYLPFVGTVMLVMWLRHGDAVFDSFATVFYDPSAVPDFPAVVWAVLAIVAVASFAPLNAPAEELVYRGYAQGRLARRWPAAAAVILPAALFAVQHFWYAPTPDAMLVFGCAFFVWGLGSGLIYLRQRRLMPLVFAHALVNLIFSAPALAIPFAMNGA